VQWAIGSRNLYKFNKGLLCLKNLIILFYWLW